MDDLLVLNKKDLRIEGINKQMAISKGLISGDDYSLYLNVQALYRKAFEKYLLSNVDLKKYDDILKESELDFGIIDDEHKYIFHEKSYMNLNYLYVRNYFYIEKLNDEYVELLLERLSNKNYDIDTVMFKMVEETFRDVINDNYKYEQYHDSTTTCYGSNVPRNIVNSKSLVIVLQYGKNKRTYTKDEFIINQYKKQEYLKNIISDIEGYVSNIINAPTKVLIRRMAGD